MSLRTIYEKFITSTNPLDLAPDATLNYVTTLTTIRDQAQIVKHLETQNKNVARKMSQKIIGAVEGQNAVVLEVETTLEFISGGGAYLPRLENFVTDKIVTLPVVCKQIDGARNWY